MKGAQIIIFANQKGGVGKSTCCRELGIYLAGLGYRLLLVDSDPQGNLTKGLVEEEHEGLYKALTVGEIVLSEIDSSLCLLCGDYRLSMLEKSLIGEIDGYLRLKELFQEQIFNSFDYILIDSPPSLGLLSVNGLVAARHLVIPMNSSLYSLQGTNDLFKTVSKVKKSLNPELTLLGVIINAYESIPVITRQIREEIQESFGDKVFGTVLSKSIKLEESIALKRGVIHHKKLDRSRVKDEVCALGEEFLSLLGMGSQELKEAGYGT